MIHHTANTAATRAQESGDQISQVLSAGCHPAVSRHCHAEMVSCVTLCHGQWVVYVHTLCLSPPILPYSSFHSDVSSRETLCQGLVLGHPVLTSTPFHHSTHQLNTAHIVPPHSQPRPWSACSRLNPVLQQGEKQNIC